MKYTVKEVIQFVREEDVKFIRLAFCDVFGRQKNISIMPYDLERAFEYGIAFDASEIDGFCDEAKSDLLLFPDPETLSVLPWRPEHGRVVRMFCDIKKPDGTVYVSDTRNILKDAVKKAEKAGFTFRFGTEMEFYLFLKDENEAPTKIPFDNATYMDIAPDDKGENVRREICLTLEEMGIIPESSHHEEGPGQNEIVFRYSDPLSCADNSMTFKTVVKTVADRSGLFADFSPKPIDGKPGNSLHINLSVSTNNGKPADKYLYHSIAGILGKISEITAVLNPVPDSYKRFGKLKAPQYISWSHENRSQLIRIPAANGTPLRAELRSPDPESNPYLAFALIINAALYGIENELEVPEKADLNFYTAPECVTEKYKKLPDTLSKAVDLFSASDFVKENLPAEIISEFSKRK